MGLLGGFRADGLVQSLREEPDPTSPDAQKLVDKLQKIALSAWVMPEKFEKYNEIFRKEDGERRVLFSFQGDGAILSLGLNVGGYLECDARINPQIVLDGSCRKYPWI